ncbi:hypothetical protein P8452_76380 [Trifolium repens]|nr:hypothetical protein P8452_76380 [Trifolium repens]
MRWSKRVTNYMANAENKEPLVIPTYFSKNILDETDQIMLKFPKTKSTYMCNIETSTVANKFGFYKKSLTKGWFDFVADQKLKAGDKLQFEFYIYPIELKFETCTEIPAFHSRSIEPEKTVFFEIELNDLQIGLPEFKIPYAFATFLNQWHFEDLVLCAENGHMYSCRLKHHGSINRMKLMNWNQVCENQKLKAGHVIRFKFEKYSASISSRCHIFKLT